MVRVKCNWTGFPGGPGISTFYLAGSYPTGSIAAIRTFFDAIKAFLPNTVSVQVSGSGDLIEDTTGALGGTWADTTPAVVVGTSASGYAAPTGMQVQWKTGAIVGRRRAVGKTFLVPLANIFEPGGTPLGTTVTSITAAANALLTATTPALLVWSRPFEPEEGDERPARLGSSHAVTSVNVPDKAVVLRSRRD